MHFHLLKNINMLVIQNFLQFFYKFFYMNSINNRSIKLKNDVILIINWNINKFLKKKVKNKKNISYSPYFSIKCTTICSVWLVVIDWFGFVCGGWIWAVRWVDYRIVGCSVSVVVWQLERDVGSYMIIGHRVLTGKLRLGGPLIYLV